MKNVPEMAHLKNLKIVFLSVVVEVIKKAWGVLKTSFDSWDHPILCHFSFLSPSMILSNGLGNEIL